jgi:DNA-binding SARP family transcriptional activator
VETTVHRLRKLLGEDSIVRQESQLTLNRDYCWVDVFAFENLLDTSSTRLSPVVRTQRLLTLYKGVFLEEEEEAAWIVPQREKLQAKFLHAIVQLGEVLEAQGSWREAISAYQKGIEIDPLAEEFYRRLMGCYRRLDRVAEALAAYRRCREALASALGVEPSPATTVLYAEIQRTTSPLS